jgi:hypothetical protein
MIYLADTDGRYTVYPTQHREPREREKENPELLPRLTANAAGNPDGTNAWVHNYGIQSASSDRDTMQQLAAKQLGSCQHYERPACSQSLLDRKSLPINFVDRVSISPVNRQ